MQKNTKIVCTIGPASESVETLVQLMEAGMNVARLNFSHGSHEEHEARIKNIREAAKQSGKRVALLLDTKGPEIRTHNMVNHEPVLLEKGTTVSIFSSEVEGDASKFSITYPELIDDVHVGSHILVDDGLVDLLVTDINKADGEIVTVVENSGIIKDKKGVNVPGVSINLPGITDKDEADIRFGLEQGIDFIAASFVRKPEDILEIREILEETGNEDVQILPKIENQEGVDNIKEIMNVSDGLMIARGDLGVEIPVETVPIAQKDMIELCNSLGKPVITATQMLDSMQRNPRPTRAEASDVANAIYDGTDAIMLSGETAAGDYPVEAVQTMNRIALATEAQIAAHSEGVLPNHVERGDHAQLDVAEAISQSVAYTASNLGIRTIVAATDSGFTAKMISKYRPNATILALTFSESRANKLMLSSGVEPIVAERPATTDDMMILAANLAKENGYAQDGDKILVTAGVPVGERGTTNLMKIQIVGRQIVRGQGIGENSAVGHVVLAKDAKEANEKVTANSVLVVKTTDESYNDAISKAKAVIVEEGGVTSHAAVLGINTNTPVIVGAEGAVAEVTEGQLVTVDARRGVVYEGGDA
ncbi:pyruvate kinase [Aerococcus sanguinicola]|uniref:pyruvate kinase n=1 Tax=unclassified Aerococcus TaxID=2618060 RepID=UPI0008A23164|nr:MULTISPECIES: pyruvate kinase [unclassified Aerococcus]KAB0647790.1 pyruvate kinase [Aerococcus sanguinicola]MDK6232967.1 pyruvate kinase [Aerococcus sp. UMB10185]MDK6855261.1 pyruvate kinase [Aerococcus sp. UMB7533]MDK8502092.1 pyruvate kinase [Aerococcus sp. UMB1112A]OFN05253.1 pyruvate kinase [Aerococcus sp. HMSC062A02]